MTLDPDKLRVLRREAMANKPRPLSEEELRDLAEQRCAARLNGILGGISSQLEKAARSGHSCVSVYSGYRDEPDYKRVLDALCRAGLNVREKKSPTSGWFSGQRSIVVYLD